MFGTFNITNIENAVLNAFVFASEHFGEEGYFKLNPLFFTHNFRKEVAELINETLGSNAEELQIKLHEFELSLKDEYRQRLWLDILSQNPLTLSMAKRYHNEILSLHKLEREAIKRRVK
ncbi:MAG: hypothetical protein LBG21_04075 [Campylobacteraceae bacterium]|jgi:hypothetical protein|nr:hypothetical protein [Campylobacteraceae bacterium]